MHQTHSNHLRTSPNIPKSLLNTFHGQREAWKLRTTAINHVKLGVQRLISQCLTRVRAPRRRNRGGQCSRRDSRRYSPASRRILFSIHPWGFTLMPRDGDAAWRFRFIESSLGRCNGTRNVAYARLPRFISSGKALRLLYLFCSYACTHLHSYTSVQLTHLSPTRL